MSIITGIILVGVGVGLGVVLTLASVYLAMAGAIGKGLKL